MDETNANANAPNIRHFPLRSAMIVREMSTSIVPDVLFEDLAHVLAETPPIAKWDRGGVPYLLIGAQFCYHPKKETRIIVDGKPLPRVPPLLTLESRRPRGGAEVNLLPYTLDTLVCYEMVEERVQSPDSLHFFGLEHDEVVTLTAAEYVLLLSAGT